jgi:hypothetical protein
MNSTLYVVADVVTQELRTIGDESPGSFSFEAAEARAKVISDGVAVFACDGVNEAQQVSEVF